MIGRDDAGRADVTMEAEVESNGRKKEVNELVSEYLGSPQGYSIM